MTKEQYKNAVYFLEELVSTTEEDLAHRADALTIIDAMIEQMNESEEK
jgi:hypothetical protein